MSYKCMMCQQPISKNEDEWGMEISPTKWMHYKCIEHLWDAYSSMKQPAPNTRVRCTADGEYPIVGQQVEWESRGGIKRTGIFSLLTENGSIWKNVLGLYKYSIDAFIYWQPLTSLKAQYEKQKEGEK